MHNDWEQVRNILKEDVSIHMSCTLIKVWELPYCMIDS